MPLAELGARGTRYLEEECRALFSDRSAVDAFSGAMFDGLWCWDLQNPENHWVSPTFWQALGHDAKRLAQNPSAWRNLVFHEDLEACTRDCVKRCADPSYAYDEIVRFLSASGSTLTVRSRGKALWRNGAPVRMVGTYAILSDAAEVDLTSSINACLETGEDAMIVWGTRSGIRRWNKGAQHLYGFSPEEALGQRPEELLGLRTGVEWAAILSALEAGDTWRGEMQWTSAQGRPVATSTSMQRVAKTGTETFVLQFDRDDGDRQDAARRKTVLVQELNHRVKNLFAVTQSLVNLSRRMEGDDTKIGEKLSQRISSLAHAHSVSLGMDACAGNRLRDVLSAILRPFAMAPSRLVLDGEDALVAQKQLAPIGLIMNELGTNALKHGAWSRVDGGVRVSWRVHDGMLSIFWREHDVALAGQGRAKQGFGSRLIEIASRQLEGRISSTWGDDGLTVAISFPVVEPAETAEQEITATVA